MNAPRSGASSAGLSGVGVGSGHGRGPQGAGHEGRAEVDGVALAHAQGVGDSLVGDNDGVGDSLPDSAPTPGSWSSLVTVPFDISPDNR